MKSKDRIVIQKILEHVRLILKYTEKYSEIDAFEADSMCV